MTTHPHAAEQPPPKDPNMLLAILQGMPWVTNHHPGCATGSAGPCTCGAEQLEAEIARLSAPSSA